MDFTQSDCSCRGGPLGGGGDGSLCDCFCYCDSLNLGLTPVLLEEDIEYDVSPDFTNPADDTCGCVYDEPITDIPPTCAPSADQNGIGVPPIITDTTAPTRSPVIYEADPIAEFDDYITNKNTPISFNPITNDSHVSDKNLELKSFTQPSNGFVSRNSDRSLTYTPNTDYVGIDSFTYVVEEDKGNTDIGTVTIKVNSPPVVLGETVAAMSGGSLTIIDILANDVDADGDLLSIESFTQPSHGELEMTLDGTFSYIPDSNYNGKDSFTYTVNDGNGGVATATVTIFVGVLLEARDDEFMTRVNTKLSMTVNDVLRNDDVSTSPDSIKAFTQPSNGVITRSQDGSFLYEPNAGFTGTDAFEYTISSGMDDGTDSAIITIYVVGNTVEARDDEFTVRPGDSLTINQSDILSNDYSVDGKKLKIESYTQPTSGSIMTLFDNSLFYKPNENASGKDSFYYTVTDGNGGEDTAIITILIDDAPVANDDFFMTNMNTVIILSAQDILSNDQDTNKKTGDDRLIISSCTQPSHGLVIPNADGSFSYKPNEGFSGIDSFTYICSDGHGGTDMATITIEINQLPVAKGDSFESMKDMIFVISSKQVLENDYDPDGDTLEVFSIYQPDKGQVTLNKNNGSITYIPSTGFMGTETFKYVVSDGRGGFDTSDVSITVKDTV